MSLLHLYSVFRQPLPKELLLQLGVSVVHHYNNAEAYRNDGDNYTDGNHDAPLVHEELVVVLGDLDDGHLVDPLLDDGGIVGHLLLDAFLFFLFFSDLLLQFFFSLLEIGLLFEPLLLGLVPGLLELLVELVVDLLELAL